MTTVKDAFGQMCISGIGHTCVHGKSSVLANSAVNTVQVKDEGVAFEICGFSLPYSSVPSYLCKDGM